MRSTFSIVVVWLMVAVGIYWGFNVFLAHQYNPNTRTFLAGQGQELTLQRSRDGHFRLNGNINGQPVVLLIDTGATTLTMSAALAERLKLKPGQPYISQTANGEVKGYLSKIDQLSFGPFEFKHLTVGVVPQLGDEILLGMNVIKRFDMTLKGEQMILKMAR
ncbi:retropepsin-like aspartic protease family protein [Iodobacter fluviatilis]|uniref:Aspartyl protease family protein n=1 Tax=Iodobacter fluviatilis TaxID=537 RepID=A0A377Q6R3_9NEIS|nr:retropepsin-like aspartic protease [Iodobacter fluviatilis]TCU87116.1 aspartyl protease family protein [Iodobacter fluviatilis]STQ90448.1 Predicted aspartyl protease [Iodobacter fluviatilis]